MDQERGNQGKSINEQLAEDVDRYFPVFAQTYEAPLCSYVTKQGAHLSDVNEIVHDSLVAMYFWLKGCHPQKIRESNLKSYLYKIAQNHVRIKQREYRRRYDPPQSQGSFLQQSQIADTDIFDEFIDEEKQPKGPEELYLYKEWREELLHRLPEDYRNVFVAHLDGWADQEIATHFGRSLDAVKNILRQSRKILQSLPGLRY